MIAEKQLTDELRRGRRALDSIEEVSIIHDWQWDDSQKKWYLEIIISVDCKYDRYVPNLSAWYLVVDESYPKGTVKVFPSKKSNFELTLYHQSNNGAIFDSNLWRKGGLCLESINSSIQRSSLSEEPSDADYRISWHIAKAIEWIILANAGKLVNPTDPFELPDFKESLPIIAFNEDIVSYMQWNSIESTYGIVDLISNDMNTSVIAVSTFKNDNNVEIFPVKWGCFFSGDKYSHKISEGIWVKLDGVPVVNFWQAPNSFSELLEACNTNNIDLMSILEKLAYRLRDGERHYLLVGFPIPKYFGGKNEVLHWKAMQLPILSFGKNVLDGFRHNEKGYWVRDISSILRRDMRLEWKASQNWNESDINNRGRLSKPLRSMKILIIGAGAIGSVVADTLTRAGVYNIHIQDFDNMEIGNISRHSLDLLSIGKSKSDTLVEHLHRLNPNTVATSISTKFSIETMNNKMVNTYDLIIDCTGEDAVLDDISKIEFKRSIVFASVSIGLEAKRLYLLLQKSNSLEVNRFHNRITPYLDLERKEYIDYDFPRDGVGCWSPLFPARQDDILLSVSVFIKALERFIDCTEDKEIIKIFEKHHDDAGYFLEFREVENIYE